MKMWLFWAIVIAIPLSGEMPARPPAGGPSNLMIAAGIRALGAASLQSAPTLTGLSNTEGVQGDTLVVTLTGTNFTSGAVVAVSGTLVTIGPVSVVNSTTLTTTFTIATTAANTARNVTVLTSNGTSGAMTFTVRRGVIVSPSGTNNGAGTPASPMSIYRAFGMVGSSGTFTWSNPSSVVAPGDHIRLMAGTYRYQLSSQPINGNTINSLFHIFNLGTLAHPIVIEPLANGTGLWQVILDGRLDDLTAFNTGTHAGARNFNVLGLDFTSQYVTVKNNGTAAIRVTNSGSILAERVLPAPSVSHPPWSDDESNRYDRRGNGVDDRGVGNQLLHIRSDNTGQGFGTWDSSSGEEFGISLINGWDGPPGERAHGHGLYAQHDRTYGIQNHKGLLMTGNMQLGFRVGGSPSALVQDIVFDAVTSITDEIRIDLFDNVTINNSGFYRKAGVNQQLIGLELQDSESSDSPGAIAITNSIVFSYFNGSDPSTAVSINAAPHVIFTGNSLICNQLVSLKRSSSFPATSNYVFQNNSYYKQGATTEFNFDSIGQQFAQWKANGATFDNTGSSLTAAFMPPTVMSKASPYMTGYGHLFVINQAGSNAVTIAASTLTQMGMNAGDTFTISNIQDIDSDVITVSAWNGAAYSLNMQASAHSLRLPNGITNMSQLNNPAYYADYVKSFPYAGAFVVVRTAAGKKTRAQITSQ
jgi:hypothetical protein